jgi:muramidase (phage lysozyme)
LSLFRTVRYLFVRHLHVQGNAMNLRVDIPASDLSVRYGEIGGQEPAASTADDAATTTAAPAGASSARDEAASRPLLSADGAIARQQFAQRLQADVPARAQVHAHADSAAQPRAGVATAGSATPMLWNDYSVFVTHNAALRHGSLDVAQSRLHGEISTLLMRAAPAPASGLLTFSPAGLGTLATLAGNPATLPAPLLAGAARFVNTAADAIQQQHRIAQSLDTLQAMSRPEPPPLTVQEMKDQLWMELKIPDKAFKKMSEAEIRAKYDELMGALAGPAGTHKTKVGKYKVEFGVDGNGNVTHCKVKKKGFFGSLFSGIGSFFGKFGKTLLAVCSFIPIPWIAIPARIISGVIAVVEGVKNKNFLQAVIGVAGAVAGGAGAIAGKAVTGVAAGVAKVAGMVGKAAQGVQAGVQAIKSGNVMGVVSAAASLVGSTASVIGDAADAVADVATRVGQWSNRVLVGEQVYVSIKNGEFVSAVDKAAGLVADVAGDIKGGGKVADIARQVQANAGQLDQVVDVVDDIRHGDIAGALADGARVYTALDTAFGTGSAEGKTPDVARYLQYAGTAVEVGTHVARGEYQAAFEQASTLAGSVATQEFDGSRFDPNTGWPATVQQWLDNGAKVVGIVDDIRAGRIEQVFDVAPGVINDIAWDFANSGLVRAPEAGSTRDDWEIGRQIETWSRRGENAWEIASQVRDGEYADAARQAVALGADIAGNADAGWARTAQHVIDYAGQAVQVGRDVAGGRVDTALDGTAVLAAQIASELAPPDSKAARVLQDISVWSGRGADAWRISREVAAGDYEAAALGGLELGIDLGGGIGAGWGDDARLHGGRLIETGFDFGRALDGRDVLRILSTAGEFGDAVRDAVLRLQQDDDALPRAA